MGASKNSAKSVGVVPSVSTEIAKALANNAGEVPFVVICGSSTRALFAVRNVRMAKRAVDANNALKHADKSLFSVRMGRKKNNARPAEKRILCANMANADISANCVVGMAIVNMDVSSPIVGDVVENHYVCMGARFIGAQLAEKSVGMGLKALNASVVFGFAITQYCLL
jgi:hypothetical protein